MLPGGIVKVVPDSVSQLLYQLLAQIAEIVEVSRDVLIEKENFSEFSSYLERIVVVLEEVKDRGLNDSPFSRSTLECLGRELKHAKELIHTCSCKSKIYLLVNCRTFVKRAQVITNEIGRALSLLPLSSLELSDEMKEKTETLCREMLVAEFKTSLVEEEIIDKIETGVQECQKSSHYANDLLVQIAQAIGSSIDPSSLKQELNEFKKERDTTQLLDDHAEAFKLEQIVSILNGADAMSAASQREKKYKQKRVLLGNHPLNALQSFYCPITQDVMDDPVEVCTGQTFERSAIEKWFAEGHRVCPLTNVELENLTLRNNIMLRRAIEEWRDRNTMIRLASMNLELKSEDEDVVLAALSELQQLCEEKNLHRYWIASEGLIPVLVGLLGASKRRIRKKTLTTFSILVKNHNENKERVCKDGAVEFAVRSLSRDDGEAGQAVTFLLELSKYPMLRKRITEEQGCILLLVMRTNSENPQTAADARELLEYLSDQDENVVKMAEANYFNPLIQRINDESNTTKILMANALSKMQLTDQSRGNLVNEGVLPPLLIMASEGNLESKSAAFGALKNLSVFPNNRDSMVKAGVVRPLLEVLFTTRSVVMSLREHAAAIFANLATANTTSDAAKDLLGSPPELDETIYQLMSLLNLTGPTIQSHILRAFNGICESPFALQVKTAMREGGAIQLLISFHDVNDPEVRLNSLKLLSCLTQDTCGNYLAEEVSQKCIVSLVNLISTSTREEEKAAAMGILGNFPPNDRQATEKMLQAGVLTVIVDILMACLRGPTKVIRSQLVENATGVLLRFTLPTDLQLQRLAAEHGIISLLVQLLTSGSPLTKCRAVISLTQFSENSFKLSPRIKKRRHWLCCASPSEPVCCVHGGLCSVKSSFCLLEADAIPALVQILEEKDGGADEAALGALATLLYDECWDKGSEVIAEAQGIMPIIHLLAGGSTGAQEKALWILEKLFRKPKYRLGYGNAAQMALVALTQCGTNAARPLAARILAHLNILHDQSSYF
eukprot:c27403_g1_i1 orf=540-3572(-)